MTASAAPGGVAGTAHDPEGAAGPSDRGAGQGTPHATPPVSTPGPTADSTAGWTPGHAPGARRPPAARARRRRRVARVARVAAVAVLLGLVLPAVLVAGVVAAGGCGAVRWSGLCVVDLEVHGTARVPADAVRAAAAPAVGRPLVDVDAGAVAAAVRRVPGVRDATVRASWPGTLRVEVRERTVLAAVPGRGGVRLVDADGVHLGTAPRRPAGVPLVRVDVERAGAGALLAAVRVARGLPAELRPLVREVGAATRDGVWLGLRDGSRVVWGSEEEAALKVAVLAPLRRGAPGGRGVVYDVSAPWAPAVSGAR